MSKPSPIIRAFQLGMPWPTLDPFLFCVHHDDAYPKGNADMGPVATLAGRNIGMDFEGKDGWRMYHGDVVPGFPQHPHRGFETITLARRGFIDHSDSLGATARFGNGDCQWMTAGRGIVHSEMFPLVNVDTGNPTELFQIWLNLPHAKKMVEPAFLMLWDHTIPEVVNTDAAGHVSVVRVVAGRFGDMVGPPPPPNSWANDASSDVAILTLRLSPAATLTVPAAKPGTNRALFFFSGDCVHVDDERINEHCGMHLEAEREFVLRGGDEPVELLLLQGKPIGEPVVQHGPFVMTSQDEIRNAFRDYQATQFGGWPWPSDGPVHARESRRFAVHADGRREDAE